jgi:hypothetical protein
MRMNRLSQVLCRRAHLDCQHAFADQYALLSKAPKGVFLPQHALTERAEKLVLQVETALPNILSLTNDARTVLTNASVLVANLTMLGQISRLVVDTDNLVQGLKKH